MLENVEWGEFKIGELFEKVNLKFLKSNFNKINDISKTKTKEFNLPLINAKDGDNGIMYYGREKDFESIEMSIDIVADGAISTGNVYSQPQKTGVLYNAYLIKSKFNINTKLLHFFTSTIKKSIKHKYGYENKAGWEKIKKEKIQLPIKNNQIDFEFMENFIAELEKNYVIELEIKQKKELEAYLSVSGLKNYELTEEEKRVLEDFENDKIEFDSFRLNELFIKKTIKGVPKSIEDLTPNKNGYHMFGQNIKYQYPQKILLNEKYLQIVDENFPILAYTSSVGEIGIIKENFYRTGNNGAFQGLFSKNHKFTLKQLYFILLLLKKRYFNFFNYNTGMAKIMDLEIQLPIKNNQIDFEFMEIFISAIQKLVIKDVVLYSEKKLNATKSVVGK